MTDQLRGESYACLSYIMAADGTALFFASRKVILQNESFRNHHVVHLTCGSQLSTHCFGGERLAHAIPILLTTKVILHSILQ